MKSGLDTKRDEAVAPVREGSVVFGASRYDSSLRCTRRRTQRFRRRTLHLQYSVRGRICSIRGRPFLAANVGESEARPFSSDVERVRLPCVRSRGGGPSLVIASFVPSITPRVPIPHPRFFSSARRLDSPDSLRESSLITSPRSYPQPRARRLPPSWRPSPRTSRR